MLIELINELIISIKNNYQGEKMPIYNLGKKKPQLPAEDSYWVAPDAHVIGNVILGQDVGNLHFSSRFSGRVPSGDGELFHRHRRCRHPPKTICFV